MNIVMDDNTLIAIGDVILGLLVFVSTMCFTESWPWQHKK